MTQTEVRGDRDLLVARAILLLAWAMAGAVNAIGFIMGSTPTPLGILATLAVVCAWPVAGWYAGSRSGERFVRFAVVFWIIVAVGGPLVFRALNAAPGLSSSQGGWVLPLALFITAAPLYGLVAMLPYQMAMVWTAVIGVAVLAITLGAYLAGRRSGRPPAVRPNKRADKPAV